MKRFVVLCLAALALLSVFCGCENNESETDTTNAECEIVEEGIIACNGVYRNSEVKYAVNKNNELILNVDSWGESFFIPNQDMYFVGETVRASSVVLGEDQGMLIFNDFSVPAKPIKVIRFAKGDPQVTIENLPYETNTSYAFQYCNFIDRQTGYLFLFDDFDSEIRLSKMLKTTDGGQAWAEQGLEDVPNFGWKDNIICAKMIDEEIGFVCAGHRADDNLSARTYVTTDGGKNWNKIILPPDDCYTCGDSSEFATYIGSGEAYDLIYDGEQYVLCLRYRQEDYYVYFKYASTDLKTWTFVEE